ncbi:MAG: hypothetical protein KIY12_08570 [Thermoplasmata archaeon]|uniref:Uncharacterized protein n=1 Tax=Candidatus Sysuiplasma superficiale TaxID=2823368 RepID=A0A8J8CEM0_9ARCH|nr:hypothetical protein [Candidatus Sysuiplasma superficiale]
MRLKLFSAGLFVSFAGSVSLSAAMQASADGIGAGLTALLAGLVISMFALMPGEHRTGWKNSGARRKEA